MARRRADAQPVDDRSARTAVTSYLASLYPAAAPSDIIDHPPLTEAAQLHAEVADLISRLAQEGLAWTAILEEARAHVAHRPTPAQDIALEFHA